MAVRTFPDALGFSPFVSSDVRGDVKIFDFGLAKEFKPENRDDNGTYKHTADTGSPRYMAPEVFLGKPYNETCDVYRCVRENVIHSGC